jgi:hypothetical protein
MAIINPRLGTPTNLPTGATYDLLILDHPDGFPEGKISFSINDTPRKVTGVQKVAQLFLKLLFTTSGSDVLNVSFGTRFTEFALGANRTGVDQDLFSVITSEIKNAEAQCKSILNTIDSDDASKLSEVTVLGIDIVKERIIMYMQLITSAGETAQVAIPFPQLDMALSES